MSAIKEKLNEIHKLQNIKNKEWEKLRKKYQKYVDEIKQVEKSIINHKERMAILFNRQFTDIEF